MPFYVNRQCYPNATDALNPALGLLYPHIIGTGSHIEYVSAQTIDANGLITYSTVDNATNTMVLQDKTIQLQSCTDSTDYDYTAAAAMWGFAFSMVFSLWFLSKNIGTVLSAVRRL